MDICFPHVSRLVFISIFFYLMIVSVKSGQLYLNIRFWHLFEDNVSTPKKRRWKLVSNIFFLVILNFCQFDSTTSDWFTLLLLDCKQLQHWLRKRSKSLLHSIVCFTTSTDLCCDQPNHTQSLLAAMLIWFLHTILWCKLKNLSVYF